MEDGILDELVDLIDPLDVSDFDGDGEHDLGELLIAEDILLGDEEEEKFDEYEEDDSWQLIC